MGDFWPLYPFKSHRVKIGDYSLHYLDEGSADHHVVVLLHGNPTWSFYWRTLIPELSRHFRVITPDHIGCGLSDQPQVYPYNLEQHISNLESLIENLRLNRLSLVMHDWGGAIGTGYATRHPEHIERLVVCNTSAFFKPVLYWPIKISRAPIIGDLLVRGLNAFALGALIIGTSQRRRFTPSVRAGYLAPYRSWRQRVAILQFVRDIPLESHHPTRKTLDEIESRLPLLAKKPILALWGADDPVFTVKTFLAGWRGYFPNIEEHVFDHAGHYVVEDAHERMLPLILRFLT
jgi:pimeloyl-ACP methyl ester carboxylesterase